MERVKHTIRYKKHIIVAMRDEAEKAHPFECCGFLIGEKLGNMITTEIILPIENEVLVNTERRFLISPSQYMKGEELADEHKLQLVGVYHSHPEHPAIPSVHDRDSAMPTFVYPIVSVLGGKVDRIRWWILQDDREKYNEVTNVSEIK